MTPCAIEVKPLEDYKLLVTFENGEKKVYDVKPLIRGDWFGKLKDMNVFNTVHWRNKRGVGGGSGCLS